MKSERFEVVYQEGSVIRGQFSILRDKETGVQYLFIKDGYAGGLTPLLGKDGKPVIS